MSRGLQTVNHSNQVALWSERVAACRGSGQTVAQWCKAEGIALSTYYSWQRKLFQQLSAQEAVCFAEIEYFTPSVPLIRSWIPLIHEMIPPCKNIQFTPMMPPNSHYDTAFC